MTTEYIDASNKTLKEVLEEVEKTVIKDSLERNDWNQTEVACELDMSRKTVRRKIQEYGIIRG